MAASASSSSVSSASSSATSTSTTTTTIGSSATVNTASGAIVTAAGAPASPTGSMAYQDADRLSWKGSNFTALNVNVTIMLCTGKLPSLSFEDGSISGPCSPFNATAVGTQPDSVPVPATIKEHMYDHADQSIIIVTTESLITKGSTGTVETGSWVRIPIAKKGESCGCNGTAASAAGMSSATAASAVGTGASSVVTGVSCSAPSILWDD